MKIQFTLFAAFAGLSLAAAPQWKVTVDDARVVRPIKMMNAVNNGPVKPLSEQSRGNFEDYAALKIPYARIHDGGHYYYYGLNHAVDITGIFPDFDADVNDPASYDFELTDLDFTYTETPLFAHPDGTTYLKMMPNSFALLEW